LAALGLVACLAACVHTIAAPAEWDDGRKALVVALPDSAPAAFAKIMAAFAAEGLAVQNADRAAGFVLSQPVSSMVDLVSVSTEYRATILASGRGSEILLGGTMTSAGALGGGPQTMALHPISAECWQLLERLRARLAPSAR
jgi:hypothetical protein